MGWSGRPVASSIEPPTAPASAARRIVSATSSGRSPNPFSKSAETGRSVAATISAMFRRVSSRRTRLAPSRRPRVNARPPLVVPSAANPSLASARAVPASQGFGSTNVPASCSFANATPLLC